MSSRNRHSQELHEQTATQDFIKLPFKIQPLKIVVEKILILWCEHYVIHRGEHIYPATRILTDCTQLPQQTKSFCTSSTFSQSLW